MGDDILHLTAKIGGAILGGSMKKLIRLVLPVVAMLLAVNSPVFATKEIGAKEKKPCATCHDMKGGAPTKDNQKLNDAGKAYLKANPPKK
jgi:cytochrome c553